MYSSSVTAAALLSLVGTTLASPIQHERRQGTIEWTNPDGGNMQIFFSDTTANFGNINPVDILNNNVSATCEDEGVCIQGTNDVGTSAYISGPGIEDEDISYSASGQYPSWIHNGLITMIAGVMQNQTTVNNKCYTPAADSGCDFEAYCPESFEPVCQNEYTAPTTIGAVLVGDTWGNDAPGSMQVEFTITQDSLTGLCSDLTTLGGTIAGLIPDIGGAAAGLFSLGALGCAS